MSTKKSIIFIVIIAVLLGSGALAYSWKQNADRTSVFTNSGYILSDPDAQDVKRAEFQAGSVWKSNLSGTVVFNDIQGNRTTVSAQSFAHYNDESISALADGVVVDLNDLQTAQVTNHYAVSPQVTFLSQDSRYYPGGTDSQVSFTDFLWKLGEGKYLLVSPAIQLHFAEGDDRAAGSFVEVSYIDGGVIQLQTADNLWQTVSEECRATLQNGETVDLSLRNVCDDEGAVLMDFSKIVLSADSNIELTPLTDELMNVKESVIPHFDVTAKNGEDGTDGTQGTNGELGESGDYGEDGDAGNPGTAGNNGAAGSSGTNGAAGAPGAAGSNGDDGSSEELNGDVLNFPVFTVGNWNVSATGCSGTIFVSDEGAMLIGNAGTLRSDVYLLDISTSMIKAHATTESGGYYEFDTADSEGYAFAFAGLEPDHSYRLVVSAPINTGLDGAEDYLRDFVSKTFWTDSTGIFMTALGSTDTTVSLTVGKEAYASADMNGAVVYLYNSLEKAYSATKDVLLAETRTDVIGFDDTKVTFAGLTSNTTYYARVVAMKGESPYLMPTQILTLTTLKVRATVGAPTLTGNRDSWGFDLMPGVVNDPDGGIVGYTYEFYNEGDVSDGAVVNNATPVKRVYSASSKAQTVPLDGVGLSSGKGYYVRTVAEFSDNEKTSEIVSAFSNLALITGSKLPVVYFVNQGDIEGELGQAEEVSGWYDQMCGTLIVAPGTEGAKVLLDDTHHPVVTIRASGYYYAQYPVYLEGDASAPDGCLKASVTSGGYIYISIPNKAPTAGKVTASGAANGLKPNMQYRILLTGDLSSDGVSAYETGALVGSCVVRTPATTPMRSLWKDAETVESSATKISTTMSLAVPDGASDEAKVTYARQVETINDITLTLWSGAEESATSQVLGTVTLTQDNYKTLLGSTYATADTLGEQLTGDEGIHITESLFGVTSTTLTNAVHITASQAEDYTSMAACRVNQKAYIVTDPEETAAPPASSGDGVVYVNQFSLLEAVHTVEINPAPDPVPNKEDGVKVVPYDDNKDGVKNDSYGLTANYLNSNKLTKTITFYVFDYPDFYREYPNVRDDATNTWQLSSDYSALEPLILPLTAVTAVDKSTGRGTWLAKITLTVPESGTIPQVRFVPGTPGSYYAKLYPNDAAKASELAAAYTAGTTMDAEQKQFLFFYDEYHTTEPATGHQFVFAWTLTYTQKITGDNSMETRYYPFSLAEYKDDNKGVPCSPVQDSPRAAPKIYAIPWTSTSDGVTWAVYICDSDGAVFTGGTSSAELYSRITLTTAEKLYTDSGKTQVAAAKVYAGDMSSYSTLTSEANRVFIYNSAAMPDRSVPVCVPVQWYTDKYTVGELGVFGSSASTYLASAAENSGLGEVPAGSKSKVIPTYYRALTFYHDPAADISAEPAVSGVSVVLREQKTGSTSSSAVNRYRVTVSGPDAVLSGVNGVRFVFSQGSNSATIDKYLLSKVDDASAESKDGTTTINFTIWISGELADFAGKSGVSVEAKLLYETGEQGYSTDILSGAVALATYQAKTDNKLGVVMSPYGRYVFGDTGSSLVNQDTSAALARMGSFFKFTNMGLTSMSIESTRNGSFTKLQTTRNITSVTGAKGVEVGTLSVVPCRLAESGALSTSVFSTEDVKYDETFAVPAITPIITYSNAVAGANSMTASIEVKGLDSGKLRLRLYRVSSNTEYPQVMDASGFWVDAAGSDGALVREDLTGKSTVLTYSGLKANTMYRVRAYYMNGSVETMLNMLDVSSTEIPNYLQWTTNLEPTVSMNAKYNASSYFYKRIIMNISSIQGVSNYYYTVELQDSAGDLITYLSMGTAPSGTQEIYEIGQLGVNTVSEGYTNFGLTYKTNTFDTGTHTLIATDQRVYLNFGATYQIQVKIYDIGKGPAYGGNVDENLITTETGLAKSMASITVKNGPDTLNLLAPKLSSVDGDATITFSLASSRDSDTLRGYSYGAVIIRTRLDAGGSTVYTDVSDQAYFLDSSSNKKPVNGSAISAWYKYIYLRENDTDDGKFQKGDKYTCYIYALADELSSCTTQGYANPKIDEILGGRTLLTDAASPLEALLTASVDVKDGNEVITGHSLLMASKTYEYTTSETYAGTVSVVRSGDPVNGGQFVVTLDNPVNPSQISHVMWSVSADYTGTDGSTGTASVMNTGMDGSAYDYLSLTSGGTGIYLFYIKPAFTGIPTGATVNSYTVSLEFYSAASDGTASYLPVTMVAGTGAQTNSGGTRLTAVLDADEGTGAASAEAPMAASAPLTASKSAPAATAQPTTEPTAQPTAAPTVQPTAAPTAVPTAEPAAAASPSPEPTSAP